MIYIHFLCNQSSFAYTIIFYHEMSLWAIKALEMSFWIGIKFGNYPQIWEKMNDIGQLIPCKSLYQHSKRMLVKSIDLLENRAYVWHGGDAQAMVDDTVQ